MWFLRGWCWVPQVRGASVVELGAGLGVPSLAALRCGARHVCITDVPDRLALLQNNAQLNDPAGTRCSVESLRWGDEISIGMDPRSGHALLCRVPILRGCLFALSTHLQCTNSDKVWFLARLLHGSPDIFLGPPSLSTLRCARPK